MRAPMMSNARTREIVLLLTAFGTWLLLPPMLSVMSGTSAMFGVPGVIVYLFVVWLGLIGITALIARRAGSESREGDTLPGGEVPASDGDGG